MLGDHRRVRLQLPDPPAVRVLELEQPLRARVDRPIECRQLGDDTHAGTSAGERLTAWAAAIPLRTAPSIVAGQPVAVHAPARTTRGRIRLHGRPNDARSQSERRLRLAADTRPEELGRAEPLDELTRDEVHELPATDLHQLRHAARHHRQILTCPARFLPRERTAIEDPVRVAAEHRRERIRETAAIEEQMDAHDRRVLETGIGLTEQARRLFRWRGDHHGVGIEIVERCRLARRCGRSRRRTRVLDLRRRRASSPVAGRGG